MTPVERAQRRVLRWVDRYSKGLPLPVAAERRAELESDLHEHAVARRDGLSPSALAREIDGRSLRGIPADLLWRDREMRRFRAARLTTMTPRELRATSRLQHLLYLAAGFIAVPGFIVAVRVAITTNFGTPGHAPGPYGESWQAVPIFAAVILTLGAISLLINSATRSLGVVVLSISALVMNFVCVTSLNAVSFQLSRFIALSIYQISGPFMNIAIYSIFLPGPLLVVAFALILGHIHRIERNPEQPSEAGVPR